jgi:hypothetical protein
LEIIILTHAGRRLKENVDLETIELDEAGRPELAEKSTRQRAVTMVSCEIVASLCVAGRPYVSGREQPWHRLFR